MATTTVPIGKVEVMHRLGKALPLGWGVNSHGKPSADAAEVCQAGGLTPLGGDEETAGYKGYALGMLVEVLTSVMSGAAIGPDVGGWTTSRERPMNFGHCFVVVDPARFGDGFGVRLASYMKCMHELPGHVKVPGDPEKELEEDARLHGVLLHEDVAASVKAMAERLGVGVPPVLARVERKARAHVYSK
eukprot:CAMPEP_0183347974 /NCGR_PEP_ID=MMETSP0164_2-20130417/12635_1 /TAXON_ID=221442 /ORGANISM="Coccolithus pelagicus ssp braarudi, Strain PLY182g" /LENGTH=188 /DNA_ID=CAMNT_0025519499 /DNA_START=92 /DNA_END=658 /DNA_ORIENTATION=+